jgi:hypothetical protein
MTPVRRRLALVLALACAALSARAATFTLEHDSRAVTGGEICFFDATSLANPLDRLATFTTVKCTSADRDVALPAGTWNVFARSDRGYISKSLLALRDGRVVDDQRTFQLVPSVSLGLDFDVAPTERVAFYVESSGIVIPLVPGERTVQVPADTRVFPLIIRDGAIRDVGVAIDARAGTPLVVRRPSSDPERRIVAVGLTPDRDAFTKISTRGRAPGSVLANEQAALNRVDPAFTGNEALALFSLPAKTIRATVRVGGEGWLPTWREVIAVRTDGPLLIVPTTTLAIHWSVADDLLKVADRWRREECDGSTRAVDDLAIPPNGGLTLSLAECPGLQAGTSARSVKKESCRVISSASLEAGRLAGRQTFNGIAPGAYLLRLGSDALPPALEVVEVRGSSDTASIALQYETYYGTITRDDKPIHASATIGAGAVTDADTGEYFTLVAATSTPPLPPNVAARMFKDASPITITECESGAVTIYTPDESPVPNRPFDIDLTSNVVRVTVVDRATGANVDGANVSFGVVRRDEPTLMLATSEAGVFKSGHPVEIHTLPLRRPIEVCATHADYRRSCAERFTLTTEREKDVVISADRASRRSGKVHRAGLVEGRVIWYSAEGRSVETVPVEANGTFHYSEAHAPGEIVAVISASSPLFLFTQPRLADDQTFDIQIPPAPTRSMTVVMSSESSDPKGFVTLAIGDLIVPLSVLSQHLRWRGARPLFLSPGQIEMRDILTTAPIQVIFAPISWGEMNYKDKTLDMFFVPAARGLLKVRADEAAVVIRN